MKIYIEDDKHVTLIEHFSGVLIINASTPQITPPFENNSSNVKEKQVNIEDVSPIDTSFFRTDKYPSSYIEEKLNEAIQTAKNKRDLCDKLRLLETLGCINLNQYTDYKKAELINQFCHAKILLKGDDFRKMRKFR